MNLRRTESSSSSTSSLGLRLEELDGLLDDVPLVFLKRGDESNGFSVLLRAQVPEHDIVVVGHLLTVDLGSIKL